MSGVDIAVRTDPGRDPDKQVNEDSSEFLETPLGVLVVVCDGMGGHAGGKEASELAVKTIVETLSSAAPSAPPGEMLRHALEAANARVWEMPTAEAGYRPGSTVVAALIHEDGIEIGHVGDSRLYLLHGGAVTQVTRDHSMVQELVDHNLIRPEEASKHPDANKILRALGMGKSIEVGLRSEPLPYVAGDVLVLCSDGLSDLVEPAEILQVAGAHPPAQAAGQLVDLANARGGHDNITALVVRLKSSSTARDAAPLAKTIPLTQAAPVAPAPGAIAPTAPGDAPGPTGTLVSPPFVGGAPPPPVAIPTAPYSGPHVPMMSVRHAPSAQTGPSGRWVGGPSRTGIIVGVVLAVIGLGITASLVFVLMHPRHREVRLADAAVEASAPPAEDDAGHEHETEVVPAPPLSADGPPHWLHRRDGSAEGSPTSVCTRAAEARARNLPDRVINALEAQCRASGGTPGL